MRLLAVCATADCGGAEIGLLRLLDRLTLRGVQPHLTSPGPGAVRRQARSRGWECSPLDAGGLAGSARSRARAVASWPRARALASAADVVYLNGTTCGRLLPAVDRRPVVLHVHDMVDRVPRMWSRADLVLADSEAVARALAPLRAHVVYCPIERDPPAIEPPWGPAGGPVVGFVGRIEPRKGPLDLVRAAPAIRSAAPGARIVIVGSDTFGADSQYRALVRAQGDVEHHAWIDGAAGLLGHIDVLVAPSRREPFGTVVAEAMAAGTPVVASAVDGLKEVVTDGVDGRLVAPGDTGGLARAVVEVLARRAEMGQAARASAARFDADAYAERVGGLISRLAAA